MRDPRLAYLDALLNVTPKSCRRALDIGCGEGEFSRRVAERADHVVGIDSSAEMVEQARAFSLAFGNVSFLHASFPVIPFADDDFDFVVAIASLHHMDLEPALTTMKRILRPGGTLAVHGLARDSTPLDFAKSALALGLGPFVRRKRPGEWRSPRAAGPSNMPLQDPKTTYREVKRVSERVLPGARFTRHLFFRYSMIWHKPEPR